jgi:adenine-specific DNA-methyltransferase
MSTVLEPETARLVEQRRLDSMKSAAERNKWGQFATPPALATEMAQYAWEKVRHRKGGFSFLDPAIGTGSFFSAFFQVFPRPRMLRATGIELDPAFAHAARQIWESYPLQVVEGDFAAQPLPQRDDRFNLILTNPPYVRHHHIPSADKERLAEVTFAATGLRLSGLAGLYCYFLLIAHAWLADDGLASWLIPSEFMDVNYGEEVKEYLTGKVTLLHIHRFCPSEVQFDDALVSSAVVTFEKRKPAPDHEVLFSFGGTLMNPAKSGRITLADLRETAKWSSLPAPTNNGRGKPVAKLGDFFTVKRGIATGHNSYFIVPRARLRELGIPASCVRPILPSPRYMREEIIEADESGWPVLDRPLALIDCPLPEDAVEREYPEFWEYLKQGKAAGVHAGYLASRRSPWYSQEKRDVAPLLCTYMGRSLERPFRFIWNKSQAIAANVYLLLYPKEPVARILRAQPELWERLFRTLQMIHADHFRAEGRVYGGGLFKMEPAELMRLPAGELAAILYWSREEQLAFL